MLAVHQTLLSAAAAQVSHPAELRPCGGGICCHGGAFQAQLAAHHCCLGSVKPIAAEGAPHAVAEKVDRPTGAARHLPLVSDHHGVLWGALGCGAAETECKADIQQVCG